MLQEERVFLRDLMGQPSGHHQTVEVVIIGRHYEQQHAKF